jgi:hypothetical protein
MNAPFERTPYSPYVAQATAAEATVGRAFSGAGDCGVTRLPFLRLEITEPERAYGIEEVPFCDKGRWREGWSHILKSDELPALKVTSLWSAGITVLK